MTTCPEEVAPRDEENNSLRGESPGGGKLCRGVGHELNSQ